MNRFGFVRVASAVPQLEIGNPEYNRMQIERLAKEGSDAGASLIVFPELAVTGYSCGDLFFQNTLLQSAKDALIFLAQKSKDWRAAIVTGVPVECQSQLYNAAAVIAGGEIRGICLKSYLSSSSQSEEVRWFCPADRLPADTIRLGEKEIPIGNDLLFRIEDTFFAVEICEDLWSDIPPSVEMARAGAHIICNPAASHEQIGKREDRRLLVRHRSSVSHCGYIFTSAGLSESTTDSLYSGHSLICEGGHFLAEAKQRTFENQILYADMDIERLQAERKRMTTFCAHLSKRVISLNMAIQEFSLQRKIDPMPFLPQAGKERDEQMEEVLEIQSLSLARRLKHTRLSKLILGVSGGLDSTLALLVSVRAMKALGRTNSDILAVTMPGFGTTEQTLTNAKRLMEQLKVSRLEIPIAKVCEQHFDDISHDRQKKDVTYENAQARERTQILLDLANQENGLMVGTGDLSELALGFTTYAGDHMSMYGVNAGVPKTLVRFLVAYEASRLGGELAQTLERILQTPISPELLPPDEEGKIAQKTEQLLGDYLLHDFFLYYFVQFGFSISKIEYLAQHAFENVYTKEEIRKNADLFVRRFFSQQFKRSCLPDGPKVGSVSLSPRGDWRMPSDGSSAIWEKE